MENICWDERTGGKNLYGRESEHKRDEFRVVSGRYVTWAQITTQNIIVHHSVDYPASSFALRQNGADIVGFGDITNQLLSRYYLPINVDFPLGGKRRCHALSSIHGRS